MIRNFALAMVFVSSFASTAAFAAPVAPVAATPVYGKAQMVKFTLRNDTKEELKLAVGDQQLSIAPGQSLNVKLPLGQQIVASAASTHFAQGDVVSTVADMMNGNTLAIR